MASGERPTDSQIVADILGIPTRYKVGHEKYFLATFVDYPNTSFFWMCDGNRMTVSAKGLPLEDGLDYFEHCIYLDNHFKTLNVERWQLMFDRLEEFTTLAQTGVSPDNEDTTEVQTLKRGLQELEALRSQ